MTLNNGLVGLNNNQNGEWKISEKIKLLELFRQDLLWEQRVEDLIRTFTSREPGFFNTKSAKDQLNKIFSKSNPEIDKCTHPIHSRGKESAELWIKHFQKELADKKYQAMQMLMVALRRDLDLVRRVQTGEVTAEEIDAMNQQEDAKDALQSEDQNKLIYEAMEKGIPDDLLNIRNVIDFVKHMNGERIPAPPVSEPFVIQPSNRLPPMRIPSIASQDSTVPKIIIEPMESVMANFHPVEEGTLEGSDASATAKKTLKNAKLLGTDAVELSPSAAIAKFPQLQAQLTIETVEKVERKSRRASGSSSLSPRARSGPQRASAVVAEVKNAAAASEGHHKARQPSVLSPPQLQPSPIRSPPQPPPVTALPKEELTSNVATPPSEPEQSSISVSSAEKVQDMAMVNEETRPSIPLVPKETETIVIPEKPTVIKETETTVLPEKPTVRKEEPDELPVELPTIIEQQPLESTEKAPAVEESVLAETTTPSTPLITPKKRRRRRQEELLGLDTTIKNTPPSAEVLNGGGEPLQQQTPQSSDTIGTRSRRTSLRKSESLAVSKAPINQDVETTMVKKKTLESVVSEPVTQTEASLQAAKKDAKPTTSVVQSLRKTTRRTASTAPPSNTVMAETSLAKETSAMEDRPIQQSSTEEKSLAAPSVRPAEKFEEKRTKIPPLLRVGSTKISSKVPQEIVSTVAEPTIAGNDEIGDDETVRLPKFPSLLAPKAQARSAAASAIAPATIAQRQQDQKGQKGKKEQRTLGSLVSTSVAPKISSHIKKNAEPSKITKTADALEHHRETPQPSIHADESLQPQQTTVAEVPVNAGKKEEHPSNSNISPPTPPELSPLRVASGLIVQTQDVAKVGEEPKTSLAKEPSTVPDEPLAIPEEPPAIVEEPTAAEQVKESVPVPSTSASVSKKKQQQRRQEEEQQKLLKTDQAIASEKQIPTSSTEEIIEVNGDEEPQQPPLKRQRTSLRRTDSLPDKKFLLALLDEIIAHRHSPVFMHPVGNEAPGYRTVVKDPIDMTMIKRQIESGVIRTFGAFKAAIVKVFANAIMFNSEGSKYHSYASEMFTHAIRCIQSAQFPNGQFGELGAATHRKRQQSSRLKESPFAEGLFITPPLPQNMYAYHQPTNSSPNFCSRFGTYPAPMRFYSESPSPNSSQADIWQQANTETEARHIFTRRPPRQLRSRVKVLPRTTTTSSYSPSTITTISTTSAQNIEEPSK